MHTGPIPSPFSARARPAASRAPAPSRRSGSTRVLLAATLPNHRRAAIEPLRRLLAVLLLAMLAACGGAGKTSLLGNEPPQADPALAAPSDETSSLADPGKG